LTVHRRTGDKTGSAHGARAEVRVNPAEFPSPWWLGPIAVIDTETTGLEADRHKVIEIAIIRFEGGDVVERWSALLDPGMHIPEDATKTHGIKDEDVRGQPSFAAIVPELRRLLRGAVCAAYNAPFDRGMIEAEFKRLGAPSLDTGPWLDPLVYARQLHKGQQGFKLGIVAARLGVTLDEAHRAASDAECAGHILLALARKYELPKNLDSALALLADWHDQQQAERAGWKGRRGDEVQLLADTRSGPKDTLGPAYLFADEVDPVRFMFQGSRGRR